MKAMSSKAAAMESYAISRDVIYPEVRKENGRLGADYKGRMRPLADGRLKRAGVRLAALLDQAFAAAPDARAVDMVRVQGSVDKVLAESPL